MSMSDDLDRVTTVDGGDLRFSAEMVRRRDDRVLGGLISSEYVQPLGTFAGTLPGRLELATGFGVLERHRARWWAVGCCQPAIGAWRCVTAAPRWS